MVNLAKAAIVLTYPLFDYTIEKANKSTMPLPATSKNCQPETQADDPCHHEEVAAFPATFPPAIAPESLIPTEEELRSINAFVPPEFEPLTANEVRVTPTLAATNNLVARSGAKWSVGSLQTLAQILVGKPALFDHNGYDVRRSSWGRIFEAKHVSYDPANVLRRTLDVAGNLEYNLKIVQEEGLHQVLYRAFLPARSSVLSQMRFAQLAEVSIGYFRYREIICPECGIPARHEDCPHYIPFRWGGYQPLPRRDEMPYYIREGLFDIAESSLVATPDVPGAGVIWRGAAV